VQNSIFTSIFSQKIFHRRSLFHMAGAIFHKFAPQIYFIVGWAYPYAQPTNSGDPDYFAYWATHSRTAFRAVSSSRPVVSMSVVFGSLRRNSNMARRASS